MADVLKFNPDDFTLGDIEDFEEAAGTSFFAFAKRAGNVDTLSVKEIKALVYVIKRREDPAFTLDDARNVKVADLAAEAEVADPQPAESASAS